MSSYKQWAAAKPKPSVRVTWVCGSELVLVREVIDATLGRAAPEETEIWRAGSAKEKDIWSAVLAVPFRDTRAVVVRSADRLTDWRWLRTRLLARTELRASHLILHSGELDFPRDDDGQLAVPVSWLRDSSLGQMVRCAPLAREDAVSWAQAKFPGMTLDHAERLYDRASGSLSEISTVLMKVRYLGGRLTDDALDMLCSELPGDFADKLILGDRKGAMLAAEEVSEEVSPLLGLLASRLLLLSTLHRARRDRMTGRDISMKLGVSSFLLQKYGKVAEDYGERRLAGCWGALAVAEDAYRSGIREGVAEVLVASW